MGFWWGEVVVIVFFATVSKVLSKRLMDARSTFPRTVAVAVADKNWTFLKIFITFFTLFVFSMFLNVFGCLSGCIWIFLTLD